MQVGEIAEHHQEDVRSLVQELLPLAQAYVRSRARGISAEGFDTIVQQGSAHGNRPAVSIPTGPASPMSSNHPPIAASSRDDSDAQLLAASTGSTDDPAGGCMHSAVDRTVQALLAYSHSIASAVPSRDMALREFPWRNGFFLGQSVTGRHLSWLNAAGTPPELLSKYGAG
jgi:hypothetical protein